MDRQLTLHLTATVLPGNKLEILTPEIPVGETVEVIVTLAEATSTATETDHQPDLTQRQNFLKLPLEERRHILAEQAEAMLSHYQQDTEWLEPMVEDFFEY